MVWKSNLNEIETEVLDTTSGLARARAQANTQAAVSSAQNARPASSRVQRTQGASRTKVQTTPINAAPSPVKSQAQGGDEYGAVGG